MKRRRSAEPRYETEADLARDLCAWLEAQGWETYKEVHIRDGYIDVVARMGDILWAIETKLRLTDQVVCQAVNRLLYAHYVSVACARQSWNGPPFVFHHTLEHHGIGYLTVEPRRPGDYLYRGSQKVELKLAAVREEIEPKIGRPSGLGRQQRLHNSRLDGDRRDRKIRAARIAEVKAFLRPELRSQVAGGQNVERLTPWKLTVRAIKEFLAAKGPATAKQIAEGISHHYGTPSAARAGVLRVMAKIEHRSFKHTVRGNDTYWEIA